MFGITFNALRMGGVVDRILNVIKTDQPPCRYIVTPNVDHVVQFQNDPALQAAYHDAELVVADGKPILWAARLLKRPIPETVPGSDLVPAIFDALNNRKPLRVFLLGAGPMVAQRAATKIVDKWRSVAVAGVYSPPLGFEQDEAENEKILALLAHAKPDLLIVGLGAPKQEVWVKKYHKRINAKVALCAGATIDFLAENTQRAPMWMRRSGLEWLHRLSTDPKRLWKRYARGALMFPVITILEVYKR